MHKRAVPELGAHTEEIRAALALPSGAKFYRCALQVNPFSYQERHRTSSRFASEDEYNEAMVAACHEAHIDVIAVTDHYRVKSSERLLLAARQNGIHAFPGFEASTKDGVHILCIFDERRDIGELDRIIGDCGVYGDGEISPRGKYDTIEFLEQAKEWRAQCIAAHVTGDSGLLKALDGQGRINAWKHAELLACAIPGSPEDLPEQYKVFALNENKLYCRERLPAFINASDINAPEDFEKEGASCFIKMSCVSIEGLRQAFLDPESRVRLPSGTVDSNHARLEAVTWQGGFLDGETIRFNSNFNAVIGGRGVGKSTVVESIRYAFNLEAIGNDAQNNHDGVILKVLQPGTRVSVLVRLGNSSNKCYMVERTVPNRPLVKDGSGVELEISPADIVPQLAIYGQREIAQIAMRSGSLVKLLERFGSEPSETVERKSGIQRELQKSRNRILETKRELADISRELEALPGLEETLSRIRESGIGKRLEEKSLLNRESRVFSAMEGRMDEYRQLLGSAREMYPADTVFLSEAALKNLPNAKIIGKMKPVLNDVDQRLRNLTEEFADGLSDAEAKIILIKGEWEKQNEIVEEAYLSTLRSLQHENIDGVEYVDVRNRVEALIPLKERMEKLKKNLAAYEKHRHSLYEELERCNQHEYNHMRKIAVDITKNMKSRLRVSVLKAGGRCELERHLKKIGGSIDETIKRLLQVENLSLRELSRCCIEGQSALVERYNIPQGGAKRLANAEIDWKMELEELEIQSNAELELNIAAKGEEAIWRNISELSKGQQATAILLLLLRDTEAPLIVDQPEDDLDNRFISESVIPMMREGKMRRQYIFATHNANIPILGDAEQIIGLDTHHGSNGIRSIVRSEQIGSIDTPSVKFLAEEILEGGREAFETRRVKYGF